MAAGNGNTGGTGEDPELTQQEEDALMEGLTLGAQAFDAHPSYLEDEVKGAGPDPDQLK
ncbi:hypothetical protein [Spirillospora sp. CA-128828]|uniref:hypothetical protein n=1 Tax=Spirillospora sp. CA-128828 TaxID=3240033 RepID=UPI003D8D381A